MVVAKIETVQSVSHFAVLVESGKTQQTDRHPFETEIAKCSAWDIDRIKRRLNGLINYIESEILQNQIDAE